MLLVQPFSRSIGLGVFEAGPSGVERGPLVQQGRELRAAVASTVFRCRKLFFKHEFLELSASAMPLMPGLSKVS